MDKEISLEQLERDFKKLKHTVWLMSQQQNIIQKIIINNTNEIKNLYEGIGRKFEDRDKVMKDLIDFQKMLTNAVNPIIGEYKKVEAEKLNVVFSASDRGKSFDN